ncbi:MAG: hypothetical protein IJ860_02740 [Eubacterium sp.]|nr:hypothetical protein [Eubacterium sp.]
MEKNRIFRVLIRVLVLAAAVGAAAGLILLISRHRNAKTDEIHTETFGTPELPVMWVRLGEQSVNPMYGYRVEQDLTSRRTSLTLLTADRSFGVQIDPYGKQIVSVRYEITSLMDGAFVENGTVENLTEAEGLYTAEIAISTPILMDQEYAIRFEVVTADAEENGGAEDTVYYYTRLVQKTGTNLDAYLAFVNRFYRNCISKEDSAGIASYLESDTTPSRSSYANVTIRSSLDQVTWGELAPELYEEAIPEIKEINVETASFVLDYIITAVDSDGKTEYYNVHDFYRLRTNQGEILLIDMNRSAEQIFDATRSIYAEKKINLGVRASDVHYVVSPGQDRVAFVSGSDLWLYGSQENDPATCVFTFRSAGAPDRRSENRNSHIRICSVTDDGEVTFVVYGYMVAGQHEGSTGIAAYHYNESENQLEEQLFISSALDPEVLSYYAENLSCLNESGQLYLFTGTQILRTDIGTGAVTVVQDDINDECIAASSDQKYLAWMNEMDPFASASVTVLNTDDGSTRMITAPDGEKIQIVGFFNQDLVYGLAKDEDIVTDAVGNHTFGIYQLLIENPDGMLLKTYGNEGTYYTEERWDSDNLELVLSQKTDGGFIVSGSDHIINNETKTGDAILPETANNQRCGLQVVLPFEVSSKAGAHVRGADLVVAEELPDVTLALSETDQNQYFVYANGELSAIVTDTNFALRSADQLRGIVVDSAQKYVYERGNWSGGNMIDLEKIPQALLTPPMDAGAIQEIIGDNYAVLNYSGCSVESIRYQLSRGYAVAAKLSPEQNVLLVGYDIYENLWYYDPEKKDVKAIGSEDAE